VEAKAVANQRGRRFTDATVPNAVAMIQARARCGRVRGASYAPPVSAFAIRVPSVDELLDPYSVEPLGRRPLREGVRDRILRAWIDTRKERPSHLTVEVPATERRGTLGTGLEQAIRNDLARTYEASKHFHVFTRGERREAEVAFLFLIVCLLASSLVDSATANDALFSGISQGLVVLGWVAMWQPAQQVFQAVSRRLSRDRYRELAQVPIEIAWV
jgi:hypothetical protein